MFYENKKNLYLLIVAIFLFAFNSLNIFYGTPMVPDQHWAQKIFYLHVPSAWVGFLSYFIAMISGFLCVPIFKFIVPTITLIGPYIKKLDVLLPSIIIAILAGFIVSNYAK